MSDYALMRKMHNALEKAQDILERIKETPAWCRETNAQNEIDWLLFDLNDVLREAKGRE